MAFRFEVGLQFRLDTRTYIITGLAGRGLYKARDIVSDHVVTISHNEFLRGLYGRTIEVVDKNEDSAGSFGKANMTLIPEDLKEIVRKRLIYVRAMDGVKNTRTSMEPIIQEVSQEIQDVDPPSWITVYRWRRDYKQSGDSRSLIPDYAARGKYSKLSIMVKDIVEQVIRARYLTPERISVAETWRSICARIDDFNVKRQDDILAGRVQGLTYPSKSTVIAIINRLDQYAVCMAREGKRKADYKFSVLMGKGLKSSRVLEYVLMDHTKTDLYVTDDEGLPIGRCWITVALDHFSRVLLGLYLGFNPPSYLSIMQCLRHAIMPKIYLRETYPDVENEWNVYGIPETIIADNGKEFISNNLIDACSQLGISVSYSPVAEPWFKPQVERFFRTLNQRLLHNIPGKTFSNVIEKQDYDPKKNAVITVSELQRLLHIFIVDIYHQDKHRGLNAVPIKVWNKNVAQYPVRLPDSQRELDVLLGYTEERVVSRSGIELHGLYYNSEELGLFRRILPPGTRVKVKYDPTDLSAVWVYDAEKQETMFVPAVDETYTKRLSLWQHKVIRSFAARELGQVDMEALGKARTKIESIVEEAVRKVKHTSGSIRIARWKKTLLESTAEFSPEYDEKANDSTRISHKTKNNKGKANDSQHSNPAQSKIEVKVEDWVQSHKGTTPKRKRPKSFSFDTDYDL